MSHGILDASPRLRARLTGVLFLLTIVAGMYAQMFVSDRLVVAGDAVATATNILAHRMLFQASFAIYLFEMSCQIAMTVLLYTLLRPVSRSLSLVAVAFGLAGCTIKTFSRLFYIAPLLVLGGAPGLGAFDAQQLPALALLLLKLNNKGAEIALVFFGIESVLEGFLIFRSGFLPRALGVLGMLGGAGWLTFLYPPLGYQAFPIVVAVALLGSVAQIGWFIVFGVNERAWNEGAGAVSPGGA
jgi:hypothetical protein